MGLYGDWVLPRVINQALGTKAMAKERRKCLAGVKGAVLEVGFGTGLNLPFYPAGVESVTAVDPSTSAAKLARKRIAAAPFPVEYSALEGERISAPDASFDSVVTTWTLCTIPDPSAALAQMRRVLKPDGRLFLVEHGRSAEPRVQRWQDRLNGVQQTLFGGCNMNRYIERLVREAGFEFEHLEKFYQPGEPKILGFFTRGVAYPLA
jgi:ubiquinone/menaquinone biosynthesis C-methylase UbiE